MTRSYGNLAATCMLFVALAGCAKEPVAFNTVVDRPIPKAPAECLNVAPSDLKPMPEFGSTDRVEDFAAKIGNVHRANRKTYSAIISDRSVCKAFVETLTKH